MCAPDKTASDEAGKTPPQIDNSLSHYQDHNVVFLSFLL